MFDSFHSKKTDFPVKRQVDMKMISQRSGRWTSPPNRRNKKTHTIRTIRILAVAHAFAAILSTTSCQFPPSTSIPEQATSKSPQFDPALSIARLCLASAQTLTRVDVLYRQGKLDKNPEKNRKIAQDVLDEARLAQSICDDPEHPTAGALQTLTAALTGVNLYMGEVE